jgi:hypothetical protein
MTTNAVANFANRGGRPPGQRNRLSNKLITDLSDIWHQHGPGILQKMVMRDPTQLARLAYATLPKDILVSVEQRIPGGLSAEDWGLLQEVLNMIRAPCRRAAIRRQPRCSASSKPHYGRTSPERSRLN